MEESKLNSLLEKFNETESKATLFISKVNNCIETGRSLAESGRDLAASYADLQLARRRQEMEFSLMMGKLDNSQDRFREIRPFIEKQLAKRMENIDEARKSLLQSLKNGCRSREELEARNIILQLLEKEHRGYFDELDRLLYL